MQEMELMKENDLSVVVYRDKKYLKRLELDKSFHGKGGILPFSMVVGCPWGSRFGEYEVFRPTIEDVMMYGVRRETQIIFPKDAFFISSKLDIRPGSRVLEIGTGSGTLTLLLSRTVGPEGLVVTVEKEERHYKNARKNIDKYGEYENIETHNKDIGELEGEASTINGPFDAAFVDLREPWMYMDRIRGLLKGSAVIGFIVPTANQVSETLQALRQGFGDVEVLEILFRTYKTLAARLRPDDRMVGHTGYLLFARKVEMIRELYSSSTEQSESPGEEGDPAAERPSEPISPIVE
jgi:tRNA (adenine57-N1/adenine58-N1)-methyltransferase catalytic subunit